MKIALTGATGFVGRALLPQLAARFPGARLEALVLPGDRLRAGLQDILPDGVTLSEGDVTVPHDVERLVTGATYVVHLAGFISYWRRDAARLHAVNVEGVRHVVGACVRHGAKRLLHVSSVGAIGFHHDGTPADEDTPFNWPTSLPYMTTKHAGQLVVEEAAHAGELDAVIIAPASIMGPGDPDPRTPHNRLYAMLRRQGPAFTFSGGLAVVDVRDLCAVLLAALDRGAAGPCYLAVGHNVPYREVVRSISRCFGIDRHPVAVPAPVVSAAGVVLEAASLATGRRPLLTAGYGRLSGWTTYYSNARSRLAFGHEYLPFARTVEDGCRFYERTFLR